MSGVRRPTTRPTGHEETQKDAPKTDAPAGRLASQATRRQDKEEEPTARGAPASGEEEETVLSERKHMATTTKAITQPLKWHGGKGAFNGKLAKWIISLMPDRRKWSLYSEPYFGGGSVALHMDPVGISEIHNDIDGDLAHFWDCLKTASTFRTMQRDLESTPFSQSSYADAARLLAYEAEQPGSASPVDRASAFFVLCRQSRAGKMESFATPTSRTRRDMNENVSAWLTAIEGLPAVHARVKRMEFWNMDAVKFIRKFDHPRRVFYCDPTYLPKTRTSTKDYKHEMTEEQHGELLECLSLIKGRFLLSGYHSELYDDWTSTFGWTRHEYEIANNASGAKTKRTMVECVWAN